ncbi:MAG: hypothetical protein JXN60_07880 [Lentisphaerae bacterium]|nr:hypothetical protein [Lentisphaerota bacterium]
MIRSIKLLSLMLIGLMFITSMTKADESAVTFGVRQHSNSIIINNLPFGNGDIGYGIGYQFSDASGSWEIMAEYSPNPSGTSNTVDYVVIPQLNLIFRDGGWLVGLGFLKPYVRDSIDGGGWENIYWQAILGIRVPFSAVQLDIKAYYVVDNFGDISRFDFADIEFGAWLNYLF